VLVLSFSDESKLILIINSASRLGTRLKAPSVILRTKEANLNYLDGDKEKL
jgi:hypothetical protein